MVVPFLIRLGLALFACSAAAPMLLRDGLA
jgi:hypothetical protein